jgi:ATP-dependent DNA helicase RecG
MRPERLNPLFVGAESLKGVGAGLSRPLEKLGLTRSAIFSIICPTVSSAAGF